MPQEVVNEFPTFAVSSETAPLTPELVREALNEGTSLDPQMLWAGGGVQCEDLSGGGAAETN